MSNIDRVYAQIQQIARAHGAKRVILFGSRARGDAFCKSDIDVAVEGCLDFAAMADDVQENLCSLLEVDLVNLDAALSQGLLDDIRRDGRVLYEEI